MRFVCVLVVLLVATSHQANNPVTFQNARFSFYSARMIRLEWSKTSTFDDRPTITFINRTLPHTTIHVHIHKSSITISSPELTIDYFGGAFTKDSLRIRTADKSVVWQPGKVNHGNLNGSLIASDCYIGPDKCIQKYYDIIQPGLLSTDGWYLFDDTASDAMATRNNGWSWREPRTVDMSVYVDWYFMGYKRDYRQALKDFTSPAGRIPIMPYSWFGVWWSRYYPYNVTGIKAVVSGYASHSLPLTGVVLDMDWHIEPQLPKCWGWGGFDWNTALFPNPKKFHSWLNKQGLPLMLNIHTQCGVDHCQSMYKDVVSAIGGGIVDDNVVPCWTHNYTYQVAFHDYVFNLNPKLNFVEYLWTDFGNLTKGQCDDKGYFACHKDTTNGDRPLLWSNYVHSLFQSHTKKQTRRQLQQQQPTELTTAPNNNKKTKFTHVARPITLSPYGGLGNHRYPLTGSGDTYRAWVTLAWEVMMTPVAANVLVGWTHDIGGFHVPQPNATVTTAQLFLRWVQYGTFSHIFRTHCDHCEIRAWHFPNFGSLQGWYQLRSSLMPYLYTAAWNAYHTGVLLVHPVYYDFPDRDEAYQYKYQYMFGDSMFLSPVVTKQNRKTTWLPPGSWVSWYDMSVKLGDQVLVDEEYGLDMIPAWIKVGHIVPTKYWQDAVNPYADPMVLLLPYVVGSSGTVPLWEDDGLNNNYQQHHDRSPITITQTTTTTNVTLNVHPTNQLPHAAPPNRRYQVQIRGWDGHTPKTVECNKHAIPHLRDHPSSPTIGWWLQKAVCAGVSTAVQELWVSCPSLPYMAELEVHVGG